jgi:NADH-quinone oxidoreductase subunit J
MTELLFYVFAAVAIGSALGVALQRNPVGSLLFMVTSLASVAGIFVLLEAHFLAAIQVMVYAGAIMVLFLFVIMLLNLGHDYQKDLRGGLRSVLAFIASGGVAWALVRVFRGGAPSLSEASAQGVDVIAPLLAERGVVGAIAEPLFTGYVVGFEITGILLLVAIVGAVALAKRRV